MTSFKRMQIKQQRLWKSLRGRERQLSLLSREHYRSDEVLAEEQIVSSSGGDSLHTRYYLGEIPSELAAQLPDKENDPNEGKMLDSNTFGTLDACRERSAAISEIQDSRDEREQREVDKTSSIEEIEEPASEQPSLHIDMENLYSDGARVEEEVILKHHGKRKSKRKRFKAYNPQKRMVELTRNLSHQLSIKSTKSTKSSAIASPESSAILLSSNGSIQPETQHTQVKETKRSIVSTASTADAGAEVSTIRKDGVKIRSKRKWMWSSAKHAKQFAPVVTKSETLNDDDASNDPTDGDSLPSEHSFEDQYGSMSSSSSTNLDDFRTHRKVRLLRKHRKNSKVVDEFTIVGDLFEAVSDAFPANWIQCGCLARDEDVDDVDNSSFSVHPRGDASQE